jgi:dihydroorotate dehydrogenase
MTYMEDNMVSTATSLGGFQFDNCLMNAAGVWCMTKEELNEVKNSNLRISFGKPRTTVPECAAWLY